MIRRNIPNAITCLNLLCGCFGIVFALNENQPLIYASILVGLGAIFDFLDGFAARLLKVHSELGKQLDSLADMVTFGLLPGCLLFRLIASAFLDLGQFSYHLQYVAFLIPVFSALRLAKFNIDTRQLDSFIGLPTPANSILIASFPLIILSRGNLFSHQQSVFLSMTLCNPWFLIAVSVIMSFLLVSGLPLFALKFKNFGWMDNKIRYVFLGISLVLLILFDVVAVPFIILLYVLLSFCFKLLLDPA